MRDYDKEFREAGYLSDASRELIPNIRELSKACFSLADDAARALQDIAIRAVETVKGTSGDPKVVATFLMLRSASAAQGAIILAERGMDTEARTLVRSLVENAFCLGALHDDPVKFLKMLKDDADAAKKAQANFMLDNGIVKAGSDQETALQQLVASIPKGVRNLPIKDLAELSPLKTLYLQYRVLSNDSGHPSATSLQRFINKLPDGSGWMGYLVGPSSESAVDDCLLMLVQAITAIGVAFTQMIDDKTGNHAVAELSDKWQVLAKGHFGKSTTASA